MKVPAPELKEGDRRHPLLQRLLHRTGAERHDSVRACCNWKMPVAD